MHGERGEKQTVLDAVHLSLHRRHGRGLSHASHDERPREAVNLHAELPVRLEADGDAVTHAEERVARIVVRSTTENLSLILHAVGEKVGKVQHVLLAHIFGTEVAKLGAHRGLGGADPRVFGDVQNLRFPDVVELFCEIRREIVFAGRLRRVEEARPLRHVDAVHRDARTVGRRFEFAQVFERLHHVENGVHVAVFVRVGVGRHRADEVGVVRRGVRMGVHGAALRHSLAFPRGTTVVGDLPAQHDLVHLRVASHGHLRVHEGISTELLPDELADVVALVEEATAGAFGAHALPRRGAARVLDTEQSGFTLANIPRAVVGNGAEPDHAVPGGANRGSLERHDGVHPAGGQRHEFGKLGDARRG